MADLYDPAHPHEPEIPPALDDEGRCRVCLLLVERDRLRDDIRLAVAEVGAWTPHESRDVGEAFLADMVLDLVGGLRTLLDPTGEATDGS